MGKVRYSEHPSMEDAELVTLRGKKITVTDEEFAMMLEKAGGFKSRVAKQLGISVSAVCHRIQRSEYLREACKTVEETILDLAEASLVAAAQKGEPWAVTFILKCKGRKRGWIERQDVVFGDGGEEPPPPFMIELHDAQYVAAERARTDAEFAGIADELAEAARPLPAPSADAGGNGGGSPANAETRQCDEKGACSPPRGGGYADTSAPPASDCAHVVTHESAWQPKRPLRPSEVEALKRAKREAERQAQPQTAAKPTGRYVAHKSSVIRPLQER